MTNRISKLFKHFVVAAFCAIVMVTLVQVFMRYVLNSPLKWAEELSRYIFVWAIMVSVGLGTLDEAHICLNMVTTKFSAKAQLIFFVIGQAIIATFNLVLLYFGSKLAIQNFLVKSPAMKIPIGIAYGGIPIGSVVILFFVVLKTYEKIQAYRADKDAHLQEEN